MSNEYSNCFVCRGCGEEYDKRRKHRGSATEGGYCGLMCAMENADSTEKRTEGQ